MKNKELLEKQELKTGLETINQSMVGRNDFKDFQKNWSKYHSFNLCS